MSTKGQFCPRNGLLVKGMDTLKEKDKEKEQDKEQDKAVKKEKDRFVQGRTDLSEKPF